MPIQHPTPVFDATSPSSHHGSTRSLRSIELSRLDGPSSPPFTEAVLNDHQLRAYNHNVGAEAESLTLRNESSLAPVDGGYRAWSFVCYPEFYAYISKAVRRCGVWRPLEGLGSLESWSQLIQTRAFSSSVSRFQCSRITY